MDRDNALREVKARIPVTNYLQKSPKGNYCCPFCGSGNGRNKTGALKVYPETNTFHCFAAGCDKTGDVIDLYMNETGADYNTALSLLAAEIGITIDRDSSTHSQTHEKAARTDFNKLGAVNTGKEELEATEAATVDYTEYYRDCRDRLADPAAVTYLEARGIPIELAREYWLGFDPAADPANVPGNGTEKKLHPAARIIIPSNKAFYLGRAIDPEVPIAYQKINVKGSSPGIFNSRALYVPEVQEVFITEGAFDALSIIEAGAAAVALNSVDNVKIFLSQLEAKPTAATLIICLDVDPDNKTREKVEKQKAELEKGLQRLNIRFIEDDIISSYKDANERLQKDRQGLIDAIRGAVAAAAPKSEIDTFLEGIYTEKYKPVATGVKSLDKLLHGGFIPQTLILLGAEPGAGKTALATMIFENMARAGQPGIYFNLEMSKEQLLARSISRIAYQNNNWPLDALDVLQGYRQDAETRGVVEQAARIYEKEIGGLLHYNPDNIGTDLTAILKYIDTEGQKAVAAGKPAPNICVDYLQIMTGDGREDPAEMIKRAVAGLKGYATKYKAIVLAIMAQSRAANKSTEATQTAGRDTGALEYTADLQLQLIRENKDDDNEITLHVTKSRFTQCNMRDGAKFTFRGGQSLFLEAGDWTHADSSPFDEKPKKQLVI